MNIHTATPADAMLIDRLEDELFGIDAWSAATVAQSLAADLVLVSDPAGYVVVSVAGDVADLQRIAVDPGHRRTGLAHALLEQATDQALTSGAARMLLEASADNTGALAFYTAEGFVEIDRRRCYYRSGADAVVMSRILS
ncbi:MAG: GNAT family N-acetyltransferase [Marmoricola sp.]